MICGRCTGLGGYFSSSDGMVAGEAAKASRDAGDSIAGFIPLLRKANLCTHVQRLGASPCR